jgi:hypothetical protein
MRKRRFLLKVVYLGIMILGISSAAMAFEPVRFDNGSELTVYGFLRNQTYMFLNTQDYAGSGNQLAQFRTMLRTYGDYKVNDTVRFWIASQFSYEPQYAVEYNAASKGNGNEYSEFKRVDDILREAYAEWKPWAGSTVRAGRQIAIWGEALTSRVGDVIHPDDYRFGFTFANLEDSRIPQYMIRGIHDIAPLASSVEWIVSPPVVSKEYLVNRYAYQYNQPYTGAQEQRFAFHPDDRSYLFPYNAWPAMSGAAKGETPSVTYKYPDQMSNTRAGFRTTTNALGMQFGFFYWHTQMYSPIVARGLLNVDKSGAKTREYTIMYPDIDQIGFSLTKQLPIGLVRSELTYTPNMAFNTFNMGDTENGVVRRDNLKYMVAYDLKGWFYPQWHKTSSFDVQLEHIGECTPNASDLQFGNYATKYETYHAAFNLRLSTNWYYDKVGTALVVGYDTWGNTVMLMPSIEFKPAQFNDQLKISLQYIGISSDSDYVPMGFWRNKNMVGLTTQLNF